MQDKVAERERPAHQHHLTLMFRQNGVRSQEKTSAHSDTGNGYGRRTFSFGRWLRLYGVDLITMAAMGGKQLGNMYRYFNTNNKLPQPSVLASIWLGLLHPGLSLCTSPREKSYM